MLNRVGTILSWSLALTALIGCGDANTQPSSNETASTGNTAGGELEAARDTPASSYLPQGTKVIARIDFARVRQSALAADISSAIRASETFRHLAGGSGLDPVQDLDAMLVGADALYTDRRIVVLRHRQSDAEIRQRVLAMAVDRGANPGWREVSGVSAIDWPIAPAGEPQTSVNYSLVITAPHELVLAPSDELPRIANVARDHAARRGADVEQVIEPELSAMRPLEIITASMSAPPPARAGYPDPPQSMRLLIDHDEAGDVHIAVGSVFETESQASAAEQWLSERIAFYGQQMMVRAMGMNRPLEEARLSREGMHLDIATHLSTEELRRLLGLLALSQVSSSR
jgi:hypothetical protein